MPFLGIGKEQKYFLKLKTCSAKGVIAVVVRLCVMNLYLYGIGGVESPIEEGGSPISDRGRRVHMVLTNPLFACARFES
jgi:type I restriction enzyme M protein